MPILHSFEENKLDYEDEDEVEIKMMGMDKESLEHNLYENDITSIIYGSLSRYKAHLVANARSQQQGIDCDETFSPVVKPPTICTVLCLAVSRSWPIHQLDVNNALHSPFTASSSSLLQHIIASLHNEFSMTDLGPLNYFLGISAQRPSSGLFLSQTKYATKILEQAHMLNCNPCKTLVDTESKLGPDGDHVDDPTMFRSLAGALQYLTFTRPNLSYVLYRSTTTQLIAYSDVVGLGVHLPGDLPLAIVAEAEYCGVANVVAETAWVRNLLRELLVPLRTAILVYYDNVSDAYLSSNPV
ncbi:ribonuclease H-like domain-containing protein [Tanacetum coccineum]